MGGLEQLLIFKQLIFFLPVHQCIQQRKGLLVLCCRIYQRFPAAQGARHVIKLAPAHALFLQVDHLEFNAALLEIALRLFGIKALARAKDLDIHLISSCRFPAVLLYHTVNRLHRHNLRQNGQCFPQGGVCMNAFVDPELCIGCTQCAGLCPAVFRMEGVLAVAEPGPIPPEEVPQAVTAAQSCPVSAIRIEE